MDSTYNIKRIRRLNSPKHIKFKIFSTHFLIFVMFFGFGMLVGNVAGVNIPPTLEDNIMSFWENIPSDYKIVDFVSIIIYNSVDIFKISFIIIVAGFTYISNVITRLTGALWGFYNGFALLYCLKNAIHNDVKALTGVMILVMFLYCILFVNNCVYAEISAQEFSRYHNVNLLLTSKCFWQYIGWFLISFGYTLMICVLYNLAFKLLI